MRLRRRRRDRERRPALEIMREANALRNEMRITTSVARAEEIERRMRGLAVEVGALPADAPLSSPQTETETETDRG